MHAACTRGPYSPASNTKAPLTITPLCSRAAMRSMKATIAIGLKDAGMDVKFEFDLSDATDRGRFKALGTLLAKYGTAASSRERFFPLVIDNLDAFVSGTRVTLAGDAAHATKPIVATPATRPVFKNALDVAIDKANARGAPIQRQAKFTQKPVSGISTRS